MNKRKKYRNVRNENRGNSPSINPYGNTMRPKKRIGVWGITTLIIIVIMAALSIGFYMYQKQQNQEEIIVEIEMSEPTLPRVNVVEEGYTVNNLLPYVMEMDILTMRDTISPLTPQGQLTLELVPYDKEITELSYEVLSIDGTVTLKEENISEWEDNQVVLKLQNVISDVEESVLKIKLVTADGIEQYYYTRIVSYGNCYLKQNLDFVAEFHNNVYAQDTEEVSSYLSETNGSSTSGLADVTIASYAEQVIYEGLEVKIVSDISWKITECSSLFISTKLEYRIEVTEDGKTDTYNVEEFYRTGYSSTTQSIQLRQYNRTTTKVSEEYAVETEQITEDDTHIINEEKTAVAFVENRTLYLYNLETSQFAQLFTLEDQGELTDIRSVNDEYDIRILSVNETGSVSFIVFGYMNKGDHEGQVGTAVYYYDTENNTLLQKAFVANNKSYAVGSDELSQGLYYSNTLNKIYVIAQKSFYEIDLIENIQTKLAEELDEESYVISEDGKIIAYQEYTDGVATKLSVLNFETGEQYEVEVESTETITPLGYFDHDLIYGISNKTDNLLDEAEVEITPMYVIEIRSETGEIRKTFEVENEYIRDISITDNMMTMNLVHKEDGVYVYGGQDLITNNEVVEENSITLDQSFTRISPILIANEEAISITYDNIPIDDMYYAFAYGELQVESSMASEAIQYASANTGAVVNENQVYVWRSGSRDLKYSLSNESSLATRLSQGESAIDIVAQSANQNVVSYTGCTTEQMCYLINQEQLIAAKLVDDSWILLTGYNGDTMYYRDQNGERVSISMSKLDASIKELIGDGMF
ncbi:MAG: hypothetical protein R3Y58_07785 [Eubacteriales bacterium]